MEIEGRWFHFRAQGHQNVTALHRSTIEITKDSYLTRRGDCIVGVSSEASAADLPAWLKERIRLGWVIVVVLCSNDVCDSIVGRGDPRLELSDTRKLIMRKSSYVEPSTLLVRGSKAAGELRRDLVETLAEGSPLDVYVTALPPGSRSYP